MTNFGILQFRSAPVRTTGAGTAVPAIATSTPGQRPAGAANNSRSTSAERDQVGQREGRLSERLPAGSVEAAQAGIHCPYKATGSRINSRTSRMVTGESTIRLSFGASTHADSIPFPAGSIPRRPPLKSVEFSDPEPNIFELLGAFLFVSATGIGLAFALFVLLFVKT